MAEIKNMGVTRQSHYKLLINPSHALVISLSKVCSRCTLVVYDYS